jgi:hypothetical protein
MGSFHHFRDMCFKVLRVTLKYSLCIRYKSGGAGITELDARLRYANFEQVLL